MLILADVQPGETRTVNFALRTGPGNTTGVSPETVAADEYVAYGTRYPVVHHWEDRRPLAMVMTAIHSNLPYVAQLLLFVPFVRYFLPVFCCHQCEYEC